MLFHRRGFCGLVRPYVTLSIQFNSYGKFGNVEISQLLSDIFGCDIPVETDGKINNWITGCFLRPDM